MQNNTLKDIFLVYTYFFLLGSKSPLIIVSSPFSFNQFETPSLGMRPPLGVVFSAKQGRKRPLDTPKRMIESREREGERERGERDREVKGIER